MGRTQIRHEGPARHEDLTAMVDQLTRAIESRGMIGQAQGIIMARYEVDADAAFELLRRMASTRNVKLRHLAELIAQTRRIPSPTE